MKGRTALALAFLVLPTLAGCLSFGPSTAADCRAGAGPFFVRGSWGGGLVPFGYVSPLYSIDRNGTLSGFEITQFPSGDRFEVRQLQNLTIDQARAGLRALDALPPHSNTTVRHAFRDTVDAADFARFCERINRDFFGFASFYEDRQCADGSTLNLTVSTSKGTHTAAAYCAGGTPEWKAMAEEFQRLIAKSRDRAGSGIA